MASPTPLPTASITRHANSSRAAARGHPAAVRARGGGLAGQRRDLLRRLGREGLHQRHDPHREGRRGRRRRQRDGAGWFRRDGDQRRSRQVERRGHRARRLHRHHRRGDPSGERRRHRRRGQRQGDHHQPVAGQGRRLRRAHRRLQRDRQHVRPHHPQHLQRAAARPAARPGLHRPVPDLRHDRAVQLRPRRAGDAGRHARIPGGQPVGRQRLVGLRVGRGGLRARSATPRTASSGSRCEDAVWGWPR